MNNLQVRVGGDTSGFELAMARVRGEAAALGRSLVGTIGNRIAGLFAFGMIESAIRRTAQYAGQLTDMSARTGQSVEALQRLDKAASENGTHLESLAALWERVGFAREDALRDKNSGAAKAFARLGIGMDSLKVDSPDQIVRKIAEQFQNSANVEQLIAPLREIGGRGAAQMVAFFRAGMDQQYQDMQVMSAQQAEILDVLDDKWSSLGKTLSVELAPALVWLIDAFGWLKDQFEQTVEGFASAWRWLVGNQGKGMPVKEALKGVTDAFIQGVQESSSEIDERNANEDQDRKDRINRRLQFGKFDLNSIEPKEEKNKVSELQLDQLSKAGLFAGGAGVNFANSIPERQLRAMETVASEAKRTNSILEDSL